MPASRPHVRGTSGRRFRSQPRRCLVGRPVGCEESVRRVDRSPQHLGSVPVCLLRRRDGARCEEAGVGVDYPLRADSAPRPFGDLRGLWRHDDHGGWLWQGVWVGVSSNLSICCARKTDELSHDSPNAARTLSLPRLHLCPVPAGAKWAAVPHVLVWAPRCVAPANTALPPNPAASHAPDVRWRWRRGACPSPTPTPVDPILPSIVRALDPDPSSERLA